MWGANAGGRHTRSVSRPTMVDEGTVGVLSAAESIDMSSDLSENSYELVDDAVEEERTPIGVFPTVWAAVLPISATNPKLNTELR